MTLVDLDEPMPAASDPDVWGGSSSDEDREHARVVRPAMAYKAIEAARQGWRTVTAPQSATVIRAGAVFAGGQLVERPGHAA
nr:hypothetical protein [uncultured Actinoplanes sp.]